MNKEKSNPKIISFITTLAIIGVTLFISVIYFLLQKQGGNELLILSFIVLFTFVYFIIYHTLETFIYSKVKLIYKTIHRLKLGKEDLAQHYESQSNSLENVSKEVEDWAKIKIDEITLLKESAQYRREYLGNVSHELKTPIFNIQGYVMTLLDGGIDDPDINTKYLKRTEKSIERMIDLIDDLETISALESGSLDLNIQRFNLVELLNEIIDSYEITSKKKGIRIYLSKGNNQTAIFVEADKDRIHQVITNLIDNSIKYIGTPQQARIKISFYDMDENTLVEISDNGIGISEDNIPRLFERFYRVDKGRSRESGGTGLGLAIVKHIIEAHEQTINVRSTPNIGTTFSFTLKQ
ncbi:MAG: ATP-binding protein [Bacteroidales bacterium]|nr:ATP-binding protein [Bacteroidales bacterium]